MNIRASELNLVVHFSAAKVDQVDEVDRGVLVAYDENHRVVDVTVRARSGASRVDFVNGSVGARVTYDAAVDALAIDASETNYQESEELLPGFIVDYDVEGFVRGLEFLNASAFFSDGAMDLIRKRATML